MASNYKVIQCGSGLIRYIKEDNGQLWFALNDAFNALQVPPRIRGAHVFEEGETAYKIFSHEKLRRSVTLLSITQSGLFKIILRSDNIIFRAFKTWLSDVVLENLYGNDYMLELMPYIQGSCDPNTIQKGVSNLTAKAVDLKHSYC